MLFSLRALRRGTYLLVRRNDALLHKAAKSVTGGSAG